MRVVLIVVALAAAGPAAAADDWPVLRPGMWEFKRSIETGGKGGPPKVVQAKKCTSPTEDIKAQNRMLTQGGCKFSPVTRSGSVYTYSATCQMQGVSGTSKSVLTVDGDSAYTIRVESDFGGEATRELLQAKRSGDCTR